MTQECVEEGCHEPAKLKLFGLWLCERHYSKYKEIITPTGECEEPNCRARAVKDYHGRKVCADHYDTYRDKETSRDSDLYY